MKKIKLLTALSFLSTTPTFLFAAACKSKSEIEIKKDNYVKVSCSKIEKGKDLVVNYELTNNYVLDVKNSKIEFGSSNGDETEIPLSLCDINTSNKTITVPAKYVTSNKVEIDIKSHQPANFNLTEESYKKAFTRVIDPFTRDDYKTKYTAKAIKDGKLYESFKTEFKVHGTNDELKVEADYGEGMCDMLHQYGQLYREDSDNRGFICVEKDSETRKNVAHISSSTPCSLYLDVYLQTYLPKSYSSLKYDSITDSYKFNDSLNFTQGYVRFNSYGQFDCLVGRMAAFESNVSEMGVYFNFEFNYEQQSLEEKSYEAPASGTFVKSDDFEKVTDTPLKYQAKNIKDDDRMKITTPTLAWDVSKPINISGIKALKNIDGPEFVLVYSGQNKLIPNDDYIFVGQGENKYIQIKANKFATNTDLAIVLGSPMGHSISSEVDKIVVYQE